MFVFNRVCYVSVAGGTCRTVASSSPLMWKLLVLFVYHNESDNRLIALPFCSRLNCGK